MADAAENAESSSTRRAALDDDAISLLCKTEAGSASPCCGCWAELNREGEGIVCCC